MILLDLKTTIFGGLLALTVVLFGIWWLVTRRASRRLPSATTAWQVFESLPFGIVVTQPGNFEAFMNRTAQRLLRELGGVSGTEIRETLRKFVDRSTPENLQRSGLIHQPIFLRWWSYPLDEESSLLVLSEGSDQHRFMRQQAFVGQLVHELRTPLTALVAHTEIAASLQTSEAVRAASVQTIQNAAQRMGRLVRDMLELHRLETSGDLPLQPTNLVLVAEDAVAQLILRAEDCHVNLNFEADMPLPLVLAVPDRLKQVFLNLIDNAIKFCRPGDEICVCLKGEADGVLCIVKDSGSGIPEADLPHVTECFYRARPDVEGNGVGLALVTEILRHHNTTLVIESSTENPSGTSCSWKLPTVR